jgi:hypothetical protein
MAQVRFYGMKLNFQILKDLVKNYSVQQFSFLIFQLEMEDAQNWRDEYILMAYPVDQNGHITSGQQVIKLTPDKHNVFKVKDKLYLGNLPMSRSYIEDLSKADPSGTLIDHLYFDPYQYPDGGDYVAYRITPRDKNDFVSIKDLAATELKPSPPAPPPTN